VIALLYILLRISYNKRNIKKKKQRMRDISGFLWWKWSLGTNYERSRRPVIKEEKNTEKTKTIMQQCLLSEEECWMQEKAMAQNALASEINVREDTYNRMSQREWNVQTGVNPYSTNNYMDDLIVQETFLKPINSQLDRLKSKEDETINEASPF